MSWQTCNLATWTLYKDQLGAQRNLVACANKGEFEMSFNTVEIINSVSECYQGILLECYVEGKPRLSS